jgi:guanylate cyclase
VNLLGISVFTTVIVTRFVIQRDRAFRLLRQEQAKVRTLLLTILPEEIADELARSPHVIADQFDEVSVLFADLVGFTPWSSTMTPAELVEVLDDMFGCFDALVEQAGVEKIKTIGDCYMVAAGVPRPREDHAEALVSLALAMQRETASRTFHGHQLALRIGIDSGPVVAGVIGRHKFSYDLWGDVVNTASRMESQGIPGAVQITESTYERVRHRFNCTPRGLVDIKGKGALTVWLVDGPRRRPRPMPAAATASGSGADGDG